MLEEECGQAEGTACAGPLVSGWQPMGVQRGSVLRSKGFERSPGIEDSALKGLIEFSIFL